MAERQVILVRWLDAAEEREVDPDIPAWHPIDSVGFYIGEDELYLRIATSQNPETVDRFIIPKGCILHRQWLVYGDRNDG